LGENNRLILRLFSPAVTHHQVIAKLEPLGDYGSGFWWIRLRADWQGWKDIPIFINGQGYGRLTSSPAKDIPLPNSLTPLKSIAFRNVWNQPGAQNVERWGIAEPCPGLWRFGGILAEK
jgi:hypothetical protein